MAARRFSVFCWGVLAFALAVISWGYFLRISESGDGCGTSWPLCEGVLVPQEAQFPTWVELIHRTSSGLVLVAVLSMAFWSRAVCASGSAVRFAAAASLLFTLSESLFGAVLVVFGWVAEDVSAARVFIRPFHVANTFLLMAALGLTAWWATRGTAVRPTAAGLRRSDAWPAIVSVLCLFAAGAWTGLAGTAFPAESLRQGFAQYLGPEHVLVYLRTLHPVIALVAAVLVGRLLFRRWSGAYGTEKRLLLVAGGLGLAQLALGSLIIVLLHPVWLRLVHLFLADVFWLSLVFLTATTLEDGTGAAPTAAEVAVARPSQL